MYMNALTVYKCSYYAIKIKLKLHFELEQQNLVYAYSNVAE